MTRAIVQKLNLDLFLPHRTYIGRFGKAENLWVLNQKTSRLGEVKIYRLNLKRITRERQRLVHKE